jgi:hypothetical protein
MEFSRDSPGWRKKVFSPLTSFFVPQSLLSVLGLKGLHITQYWVVESVTAFSYPVAGYSNTSRMCTYASLFVISHS